MRALILIAVASIALSACDSAPSEESPVAPAVVCEEAAENSACTEFDEVVTNEDLADGNVLTENEAKPVLESETLVVQSNAS